MAKGAYFPKEILQSEAYLALKGIATQVLGLFMLKRQFERIPVPKRGKEKKKCVNDQSLSLTYIEAIKEYGITQPRLTRAIDELLAKGFLTCTYQGGTWKQDKSTYGLIDKYLLWRPGTVFEKRHFDPVGRGFRKPKRNAEQKN
jgi:hypothetical protein